MKLYQIALLALFIVSILPASLATPPMMPCSECNELGYNWCISKFQTLDAYNLPECQSAIGRCYNACQKIDPFKCGSLSAYDCGGKYEACLSIKQESGYIKYGEEKKIGDLDIRLVELQKKTCPPNADCSYVSVIQGDFAINRQLESIAINLNGERKFETEGKLYLLKFNGLYEIADGRIGIIGEPTSTELSTRLDRKSALSASVLVYNLGSVSEREKRSQCFDQVISCFNDCPQNIPKQCTEEARICPDGTAVGRDPYNNCEFPPCPKEKQCDACKREYDGCMSQKVVGIEKVCEPKYKECLNKCQNPPVEPKCSNGCFSASKDRCVSIGFRLDEDGFSMYCDIDGMLKQQKSDGSQASNSYECLGNFQSDGKCVSVSENLNILQKILKWFSKIFGGN